MGEESMRGEMSGMCVWMWSDAPVVRCPSVVDVDAQDVGKPVNVSCDVESHPAATVHWRCCTLDRHVPDSVLYEKVSRGNFFALFASETRLSLLG